MDNLLLLGWKPSFLPINTVEGRKEKEPYSARLQSRGRTEVPGV